MRFRWVLPPPQPSASAELASQLGVSSLLARCLVNRGLRLPAHAAQFLEPRLRSLSSPNCLPNLAAAVSRLWQAREKSEPIVIFGDYDVDGVTASALLLKVLQPLGWQVSCYLPHRLDEGYGLTRDAVENCLQKHPVRLILAVDCGSTAFETITWLCSRGVDVIVLDHHQVDSPAPPATALVNPRLGPDTPEGLSDLCSAGLAFKLAHAVVKEGRDRGVEAAAAYDLRPLLDLVALGTIADLVPLRGENRILVATGLERLNTTARPGLEALRTVAQINGPIGPYEVAFQLAPRLNAAGRLETATEALDLLLTEDVAEAELIATSLDSRNRERQNIERGIAEEVIASIRARFNPETDFMIVEGQMFWHVGVVGIVASRVLHEFHRPTFILGGDGHEWRGSGRSIEGFDLAAALRGCDDLLVRHGGHAMAAGLTIHPENVPALRARLNTLARKSLTAEQLQPSLRLDAEVGLGELTLDRLRELTRLQPHGQGNPAVQVIIPNVTLRRPPLRIGREQQHLKLLITDGASVMEAVWWGGNGKPCPESTFDLACAPQINEFNGRTIVQAKVLDWRPAAVSAP